MITGANKGIGFATAQAVLGEQSDVFVWLGSRDHSRGQAAVEQLRELDPTWSERLRCIELDVTEDASVKAAADLLRTALKQENSRLFGLVNNAGIGLASADLAGVINVNTLGPKRVCDALLPLMQDGGRLVNVSSASAVNFVSQCSPERQSFFQDSNISWKQLSGLMDEAVAAEQIGALPPDLGLGAMNPYGFSKACLSLYTLQLARQNPALYINACTPGYIETDMTRPQAERQGRTPQDMGMKAPQQGTIAIRFLLFGQPHGSGHYYGSDAKRSPMDRYRAPGSPEYLGH
ncbi:MAG: SDR family NAD(P)-dependent oxidoreductase [Pseudomonadota bacterium]